MVVKKSIHAKLLPYLFLTPTLILMAVFSYYAIGNAVYTSFTDSTFGVSSQMVGFTNYIAAFTVLQGKSGTCSFRIPPGIPAGAE